MDHKRVETSAEVWAVIHARHPDLKVFSSYSAPDGDQFGNHDIAVMQTSYGFETADYPIMEAKTTWRVNREKPHERINEKHEYWLYIIEKEDD